MSSLNNVLARILRSFDADLRQKEKPLRDNRIELTKVPIKATYTKRLCLTWCKDVYISGM